MLDAYISEMECDVRDQYMRLLEEALMPYGISKENVFSDMDRVLIVRTCWDHDPFKTTDSYHIDGRYAFSIVKALRFDKNCIFFDVRLVKEDTNGKA